MTFLTELLEPIGQLFPNVAAEWAVRIAAPSGAPWTFHPSRDVATPAIEDAVSVQAGYAHDLPRRPNRRGQRARRRRALAAHRRASRDRENPELRRSAYRRTLTNLAGATVLAAACAAAGIRSLPSRIRFNGLSAVVAVAFGGLAARAAKLISEAFLASEEAPVVLDVTDLDDYCLEHGVFTDDYAVLEEALGLGYERTDLVLRQTSSFLRRRLRSAEPEEHLKCVERDARFDDLDQDVNVRVQRLMSLARRPTLLERTTAAGLSQETVLASAITGRTTLVDTQRQLRERSQGRIGGLDLSVC